MKSSKRSSKPARSKAAKKASNKAKSPLKAAAATKATGVAQATTTPTASKKARNKSKQKTQKKARAVAKAKAAATAKTQLQNSAQKKAQQQAQQKTPQKAQQKTPKKAQKKTSQKAKAKVKAKESKKARPQTQRDSSDASSAAEQRIKQLEQEIDDLCEELVDARARNSRRTEAALVDLGDLIGHDLVRSKMQKCAWTIKQTEWAAKVAQQDPSVVREWCAGLFNDALSLLVTDIEQIVDKLPTGSNDTSACRIADTNLFPSTAELQAEAKVECLVDRSTSVPAHLASNFRAYREDFIEPLRQMLKEESSSAGGRPAFELAQLKGDGLNGHVLQFQCNSAQFKRTDWKESSRMKGGSLLCISPTSDEFQSIVYFGTVIDDGDENRIADLKRGIISLRRLFPSRTGELAAGAAQKQLRIYSQTANDRMQKYHIIECPEYFEPYHRVLATLQAMDASTVDADHPRRFPIPNLLDHVTMQRAVSEPADAPEYLRNRVEHARRVAQRAPKMDTSQRGALEHILTSQVGIVQGPPGTGKTHVAVRAACELLKLQQEAGATAVARPIIVVAQTNHALDQFLMKIMEAHPDKTERSNFLLRLGHGGKQVVGLQSDTVRAENAAVKALGGDERDLREEMDTIAGTEARPSKGRSRRRRSEPPKFNDRAWRFNSNRVCLKDLEHLVNEPTTANQTATTLREWSGAAARIPFNKIVESFRGSRKQRLEELKEQKTDIVLLWAKSPPKGENKCDIWCWPTELRSALCSVWVSEMQLRASRIANKDWRAYDECAKQISHIHQQKRAIDARGFAFVGMTTSYAARNRAMLEGLAPLIMIVEEAAEVIEAHILAAIPSSLQQLVLIGDHKQLRPHTAAHFLTQKSRLDRSMFERLVDAGAPFRTLKVQRRARPELAQLFHAVYHPITIEDGDNVSNLRQVDGLVHSRYFFDHDWDEDQQHKDSTSRSNTKEAQFAVSLVRFLLCQGDSAGGTLDEGEITLLTFYAGQQRVLQKLCDAAKLSHVKVKTVDDFQGEESDVIILSTVRSNDRSSIGHVAIAHRVCVALSRARRGLVILGNKQCITKARFNIHGSAASGAMSGREIWNKAVERLEMARHVGTELPICCAHHGLETKDCVSSPPDFRRFACRQLRDHAYDNCPHVVQFQCGTKPPELCTICSEERQATREEREAAHKREMELVRLKRMALQQQRLRQEQEADAREKELKEQHANALKRQKVQQEQRRIDIAKQRRVVEEMHERISAMEELEKVRNRQAREARQRELEHNKILLCEEAAKKKQNDERLLAYRQRLMQWRFEKAQKELEELLLQQLEDDQHECAVCEDTFPLKSGIMCRNSECHGEDDTGLPAFLCDICLGGHVMALAEEPLAKLEPRAARVTCVTCKNVLEHTDAELAIHLRAREGAFGSYLGSQRMLYEHQLKVESEHEIRERTKKEVERVVAMTDAERKLDEACTHIRDNILTNKCPRCSQAFVDFQFCFALTCSRKDCGAEFCAYCLRDCGDDAHAHVANCKFNPKSGKVYGSAEIFEQCNRNRRSKAIKKYLDRYTKDEQQNIVMKLLTNLKNVELLDIVEEYA